MIILTVFLSVILSNLNSTVLDQVSQMPKGGGYSVKGGVVEHYEGLPAHIPSFCSGATYSVFLGALKASGAVIPPNVTLPRGQADGEGVWGRWNANGPGTARLFFETGAGINFIDWDKAEAGDFMKIFWTDEVGAKEHGHSVIYISSTASTLTFWSSNFPSVENPAGGYGVKTVDRARVKHAIFSRLTDPVKIMSPIPAVDPYLASLMLRRSSFAEACEMSGIQ